MQKNNIKIITLTVMLCAVNSLAAQFANFNKKAPVPPIYAVLDFIATHPVSECAEKEEELKNIISAPNFDVNLRYNSMYPPLVHLVRKNYEYLGYFSKDYISDNVIKMLIDKGARVNSYYRDGNSLATFALKTNNEFLMAYLIEQGISLAKVNKSGKNVINQSIDKQDFSMLKQLISTAEGEKILNVDYLNQAVAAGNIDIVKIIHSKGIDLNINTLTVAPSQFQSNAEVYDYVTQLCANNAYN